MDTDSWLDLLMNVLIMEYNKIIFRGCFPLQWGMREAFLALKKHQLKLPMVASTMQALGQSSAASGIGLGGAGEGAAELDLDELECTVRVPPHSRPALPGAHRDGRACAPQLANLIFSGYIKGYIAHEKRVLVLSKAATFPTARLQRPPSSVF